MLSKISTIFKTKVDNIQSVELVLSRDQQRELSNVLNLNTEAFVVTKVLEELAVNQLKTFIGGATNITSIIKPITNLRDLFDAAITLGVTNVIIGAGAAISLQNRLVHNKDFVYYTEPLDENGNFPDMSNIIVASGAIHDVATKTVFNLMINQLDDWDSNEILLASDIEISDKSLIEVIRRMDEPASGDLKIHAQLIEENNYNAYKIDKHEGIIR